MKSQTSGLASSASQTHRPLPSARTLSIVALSLWVASLALTGLVLYAKQQRMTGAEILAMGWLSPLMGNFAWFANPLFLWAFIRLQTRKSAVALTVLAILLSLDTFRLSNYLLDEGGGSTSVYAYGWGVVLWFAALCVLAAAVGTRQIETRIESGGLEGTDEWFRPIGFALCISMLMASGYLAIQDRRLANNVERERLSGLVFKRGPVCGATEPSVAQPLGRNLGPVEVRFSEGAYAGISYPLNKPTHLLKWGIPVVRVAGRDYSYAPAGDGQILTSVPASDTAAAILVVASSVVEGRHQIGAKLVEQATERVVFDQVWRAEAKGARYCPDYSTSPKEGEQPRKLITEALAVLSPPAEVQGQGARPPRPAENRVNAVIVSNTDALGLSEQSGPQPTKSAVPQSNVAGVRRPWMGNRSCPGNVGWDGWGSDSPVRLDTGWPFMVGDRAFYPGSRERYNALCAGDHAYLFFGVARDGKYYLTLEKRRLSDFHQVWSGLVVIQDQYLSTGDDVLKVDTVDEGADGLTIGLTKEQTGRTAVVKAPLRLTR
jgi:hypothetical protein